jgi:hypothetical protein
MIDTGASVNIIDEGTFSKLKIRPELEKATSRLFAYGADHPIKIIGKFQTAAESKDKITHATFHVAAGSHGSLLSYQTASALNLIRIDVNCVNKVIANDVRPIKVNDLVQSHPRLFEGIGKLKNFQVRLHIDETVKPVAQPHRRVPFHIRAKVEREIRSELEQDIIERVTGPTPWVSPIVTPPKPNKPNEIRLCIDARMANLAIKRTRYPTPTLDDLIHAVNGATVFSKIDLAAGYKQLELHRDSRFITTFSTHIGLFRYKRLSYGLNQYPLFLEGIV